MNNEQLDRLKRMAVNAGGSEAPESWMDQNIVFDPESLARFARAIAEDLLALWRAVPLSDFPEAARNLYREQS